MIGCIAMLMYLEIRMQFGFHMYGSHTSDYGRHRNVIVICWYHGFALATNGYTYNCEMCGGDGTSIIVVQHGTLSICTATAMTAWRM